MFYFKSSTKTPQTAVIQLNFCNFFLLDLVGLMDTRARHNQAELSRNLATFLSLNPVVTMVLKTLFLATWDYGFFSSHSSS